MSDQDVYDQVNRAWRAPLPPITATEARAAARKALAKAGKG